MNYVILGASAAGINGARELRRLDPSSKITLISQDQQIYSRCILHHYLSGARTLEQLSFVEKNFAQLYQIDHIPGRTCISLDVPAKEVCLDQGERIPYDKLLIATGASSFFPPIPGLKDADGVLGFRNLDDALCLKEKAAEKDHIVIMGGGLVGVDALSGLLHRGKKLVLVEMADRLLGKQLDHRAAWAYQERFQKKGVSFYLNAGIQEVRTGQDGEIRELVLRDGTVLPCDLLVVTAGVRSNTAFLQDSPVEVNSFGLVIDSQGQTNQKDIFGAGDVTGSSPIWPAAVKEGMVAARSMAGKRAEMTAFFASKATMNFEQLPSMSLGVCDPPDDSYIVELSDQKGCYKKIIHKDGKIYGAILQGDLSYGGILTQLIANQIDVSKVKKPLFEIDYSDFFQMKDNFEFYYEGESL